MLFKFELPDQQDLDTVKHRFPMKEKNMISLRFTQNEMVRLCCGGLLTLSIWSTHSVCGQIMLSGNENKIDLNSGAAAVVTNAGTDSITMLDFSEFPPKTTHLDNIPNSVIGPPSNIAISPDGNLALIANSLKVDPNDKTNWVPESYVHVMNLDCHPPKIIGRASTQDQPSGISFTPDGKIALVANRASGSITSLALSEDGSAYTIGHTQVCEPELSLSDIAISPDGTTALASVQKGSYLAELKLDGNEPTVTGRKYSVYGQPYRVVISPDGRYGITAGAGAGGDPIDPDAITIVDLKANPPAVIDHITIDPITESLEISPDGKLIAAVCMSGSNLASDNPHRTEAGSLVILKRTRSGFEVSQKLPTGRIPEGVAFTSDGKYLAVQCHPSKEIWLYKIRGTKVRDTGERIQTPGYPSSLRASSR
jgi:DNA-binding beta-propeller fold protein YncE